jgi:signal transduction histidine kinase
MVLALVVLLVLVMVISWKVTGGWQEWEPRPAASEEEGPPPQAFFFLLLIGTVIVLLVHKIRRTVAPLAQIVDATYRVASGDYSARVESGNQGRDVAGVVHAFNTMAERLETNETQRKHLLSDIAHELRTPLAVIQGTLEGMVDGVYPADPEHLAPLMDQSRTITRLLDDLQTVATAEAGVLSLHLSTTDLSELAREVASAFQPMAQAKGVTVRAEGDEDVSLEIDPIRIRQVLDNLVSNALRHTDAGGSITLRVRRWADEVELAVRDTGHGMTQAEADRMFERFVKSADSGGSGLGLTIARGLVQAHRGTIAARSAPGEGTTINVRLPVSRDPA